MYSNGGDARQLHVDALASRLAAYHRRWQEQNKRSTAGVPLGGSAPCLLLGGRTLRTTRQRLDRLTFDNHALHSLVTTFSDPTSRSTARVPELEVVGTH